MSHYVFVWYGCVKQFGISSSMFARNNYLSYIYLLYKAKVCRVRDKNCSFSWYEKLLLLFIIDCLQCLCFEAFEAHLIIIIRTQLGAHDGKGGVETIH